MSVDRPSRAQIERVCCTFSDETTMGVFATLYVIRKAGMYGRAHQYLAHFLEGTGRNLTFDLADLLGDVPAVKDRIVAEIRADHRRKQTHGRIEITQRHYQARTQRQFDWQYALGGFIVAWRPIWGRAGAFRLTVLNKYQWHAEDRERTRCIHEAGERLDRSGKARNFMMMGETVLELDPTL
jgi:hypothetical protein